MFDFKHVINQQTFVRNVCYSSYSLGVYLPKTYCIKFLFCIKTDNELNL